jgi:hypothetical protein
MLRVRLSWVALGFVLGILTGGGASAAPSPETMIAPPAGPPPLSDEPRGADAALGQALERALADGWDDLHLLAQCQVERSLPSTEIFGNGIGIWRERLQFRLPPEQISAQLEAISESGFAGWPASFGGKRDLESDGEPPPRVTCRVSLDIDGHHKQVVQFSYGEQSPELLALARGILDACRGPARSGLGAASLNDGLAKVATGELDPVTLQVIVNRKAPLSPREVGGAGWLLRVEGGQVTTRGHTREGGYGDPVARALDDETLVDLTKALRKADVDGLPPNLYAEIYTDVVVSVLDRRAQVQARRFEGMTPETHGEKQKRFDQLLTSLQALRESLIEDHQ